MSCSRSPAVLFILAALFFWCGTWSLPLIDRDEPRFAEAAREMRQGGDYVVPYFNHLYRFDKPPLTYWAQIAAYDVFGENDFAARLPSVLAAALTVLAIFGFATRLYGRGAAWAASLIFMTCVQTFMHSKGAVADMIMVLFFTIAMWAGAELLAIPEREKAGGDLSLSGIRIPKSQLIAWWLVFYVALALGFLAKGPVAWLPLGAVGLFAAIRKPGGVAKRFRFELGLLLMLALVGAWGIPALIRTDGQFFWVGIGKHVVGRSLTTMEGHGGKGWLSFVAMLPFFFVTVFLSFFPWSLRLPWLVGRLKRALRGGSLPDAQFFLLAGVGVVFGVFTLVRTKLPHYTLPAFPLMAIVLARELETAAAAGKSRLNVGRWAAITMAAGTVVALIGFPLLAHFFPGHELIVKSKAALRPDMEFASTDFQEPSLVWYARKYVRGWYTPLSAEALPAFMAKPGPRFCVAPAGTLKAAPGWEVFEAHGFNLARGKNLALQLLVKPE